MIWLNSSIHFETLFVVGSNDDNDNLEPVHNTHVASAFKFVKSSRMFLVEQQQLHKMWNCVDDSISCETDTTTNKHASLIESMRFRADYLLQFQRLPESLLDYELLLKTKFNETNISNNEPVTSDQQLPTEQSNITLGEITPTSNATSATKKPLKSRLPKSESHLIYNILFEFVFSNWDVDFESSSEFILDVLKLKRENALCLSENLDLMKSYLYDLSTSNEPNTRQNLELVLIFISNLFSTSSRTQFASVGLNKESMGSNTTSNTTRKAKAGLNVNVLFPPTLKFKPDHYLDGFYGCGLDVENKLRVSFYEFLRCFLQYSKKLRYFDLKCFLIKQKRSAKYKNNYFI